MSQKFWGRKLTRPQLSQGRAGSRTIPDPLVDSVINLSFLKLKFKILIIKAGRRSKVSLLYSYLKSKPMLAIFGGILSFFDDLLGQILGNYLTY